MTKQNTVRRHSIPPAAVPSDWLAAVDIGSNSFRLEIARVVDRRYQRIDSLKETVRLGAGLNASGQLTEEAMGRAMHCLREFAQRLQGFAAHQVRAVATQTVREAHNRDEFLRLGADALGHPIEIVSGREEARLTYAGVVGLGPISTGRRLVVDIGGRSTEMILGEGSTPLAVESFAVGSVGLSMRFFPEGKFTRSAFQAAQLAAGAALEEAMETFEPGAWSEALGSSGTAGAVSQLLAANRITDGAITVEGLAWCIEQCLEAGSVSRLELAGLKDDRRAVLGGGLSILMALLSQFEIEAMRPTKGALRQGLIFDLEERLAAASQGPEAHDARNASVRRLQQRFQIDPARAQRVQTLARQLHGELEPHADANARHELDWAAALHEIGMMLSHHDHHRHSAYLVTHADAPGFSQSQQRRLAMLVLGQRGRLRKIEEWLTEPTFVSQVLALRLAVLLCHARTAPPPDAVRMERVGRTVVVNLKDAWARENSHHLYLLQEEKAIWERTGVLRLAIKIARRN